MGVTVLPATGRAGVTRNNFIKKWNNGWIQERKQDNLVISTFRLYIPSSSSLVLSNAKNGLDNLALRVLNTITYRQMSPVCD